MHTLATTKPNLPAPTKLTFDIACPRCTYMVHDLPTRDTVRLAYGQHACVEPLPEMTDVAWHRAGLGWYLRGSDAMIFDGDRLTCPHCEKTVVDAQLVGHWDLAQDWLLIHALDCHGSTAGRKRGCCGFV